MEGNTGPTLDSHRLITFAARHNKQDELVEELFRNYFLEAKTICDKEVLLAAAEKASARPLPV
jgi:predicted DsbA family dithiol-disulfide isomerase